MGWKPIEWHVGEKIMNNIHDKLNQFCANDIINYTADNKNETGVPATGSTWNYIKADVPHHPFKKRLPIHVRYPNGKTMKSSKPCFLDFPALPD